MEAVNETTNKQNKNNTQMSYTRLTIWPFEYMHSVLHSRYPVSANSLQRGRMKMQVQKKQVQMCKDWKCKYG